MTPSADTEIITLTTGKTTNTFGLQTSTGYLYAASSSNNSLKTETTLTNNSSWEITINNGVATVKSKGSNSKNLLRYLCESKLLP